MVQRICHAKQQLIRGLSMFILLPVELILLILSFLPTVRDKIRLRCVSRKLRSICETPSLWRKFEWSCYEDRECEEVCVHSVLKSCGEHVKLLSFPDHVPPSKLGKMLDYCCNANDLNIPTTQLNLEQMRSVLDRMKSLQKLDVQWNRETWRLLKLTFNTNLKELTIRVIMNTKGENRGYEIVNTGPFVAPIYAWIKEWMSKEFVPQTINFVTSEFDADYHTLVSELFRVWLRLNCDSPAGHTGFLAFYAKTSLNLFPAIPDFQIEFGQAAVLPIVKTSDFAVLGLDGEWVYLTHSVYKGNTVYKAACMDCCKEVTLKYVGLSNFKSVVHFDLSGCRRLLSGHLEQVAIACPNLQRLSLQCNKRCLRKLQGLRSIATHCVQLRGLNLVTISKVENQVQFWEILSSMRLTHLALDICLMEPATTVDDRECLINLYQKFVKLTAIELNSALFCESYNSLKDKQALLLPYFSSLEFCMISNIHPMALIGIINSCKELKYFSCGYVSGESPSSVCSYSLQEIYFASDDLNLTDTFMSAISAHGGLVHVVSDVRSVTSEGITALVMNSPNLLTFHIFVEVVKHDQGNLFCALKEKFYNRKLFTMGSYKLVQGEQEEYEHNANFLSLWKYPFWADIEVENTPSHTDVLTTADFDKHPDPYITEEFGLSW